MKNEDPIEELFRQNSAFDEHVKPRDIVWDRIETKLKPVKEQPVKKFISGIWFSAAVFALIAIPYFVLLIENINQTNALNALELTKAPYHSEPVIHSEPIISSAPMDTPAVVVPLEPEKILLSPTKEIVKIIVQPTAPTPSAALEEELSMNSVIVLDSIQSKDQYVVLRTKKQVVIDTIKAAQLADTILYVANRASVSHPLKSTVSADKEVAASAVKPSVLPQAKTQVKPQPQPIDSLEGLRLLPRKLIIKDDVLRTSFVLTKTEKDALTFQNKTILVIIKKENNKLRLYSNSQHLDDRIIKLLESNKEKIYSYYKK